MSKFTLTGSQQAILDLPIQSKTYLNGPAGSGKTTAAVHHILRLVEAGIDPDSICVIAPQRQLLTPYDSMINSSSFPGGILPRLLTFGGLARRMVSLFWPLIREAAGFAFSAIDPVFLTHETAQYYMSKVVSHLIEREGFFQGISINPNRLYSQILDNLNKSAIVGFSYQSCGERLRAAWTGEASFAVVYDQAQQCMLRFREYCMQHNLLDFSLQVEVFRDQIWSLPLFSDFWFGRNKHLVYDNIEEDAPVFHDLALSWQPHLESVLFISDDDGGFRTFLAADPESALRLKDGCNHAISLDRSFVQSGEMLAISQLLSQAIQRKRLDKMHRSIPGISVISHRFVPEMVSHACHYCANLIENGMDPGQIAIISPFISDTLLFSLLTQLKQLNIPAVASRPSRSLIDEPVARCLIAWAKVSHPEWSVPCSREELRSAMMMSFSCANMIKADLLSRIVYKERTKELLQFSNIDTDVQERIDITVGKQYETIRDWIHRYKSTDPAELDLFLSRLFGEVLSQPGFRMHQDTRQASICNRLIESARKFRQAVIPDPARQNTQSGEEYVNLLISGVLLALPTTEPAYIGGSITIAPAFTFLTQNRPVDVQLWLDIGSRGWWERLFQPLTHPRVLSRQWQPDRKWTDSDEVLNNRQMLEKVIIGLTRRCKQELVLSAVGVNEQGYEDRGLLLRAVQSVLQALPNEPARTDV